MPYIHLLDPLQKPFCLLCYLLCHPQLIALVMCVDLKEMFFFVFYSPLHCTGEVDTFINKIKTLWRPRSVELSIVMLLLRFIIWPFSGLVEFILNHVSELPEYLVLPLHSLLLAEHGQGALFIRRVNLVFFPQPESKVTKNLHLAMISPKSSCGNDCT